MTRFNFVTEQDKERLDEAMSRFSKTAWLHRSGPKARGKPMGAIQLQNWREFLRETDRFLAAGVVPSSDQRMLRLRATIESELESDAQTYSQISESLQDDILEHETKLGLRMARVQRASEDRQGGASTTKTYASKLGLIWPLSPIRVNSLYGKRFHPIAKKYRMHQGLDLAAYTGQSILCAKAGVVRQAGPNGGHGIYVLVDHADGSSTSYSHLSKLLVRVGMNVGQGVKVGLAGSTGASTGPHLHFEVWRRGNHIDPLTVLSLPSESEVKTVAGNLER
ncbi:MAG: M23 family metallopeptidase [Myxococcaceae bacterium]